MSDQRDEELGAALHALPVPEHGPAFAADLAARLEQVTVPSVGSPRWHRPALAVAAVAAVAVLVFAVTAVLPANSPKVVKPRVATAAEVRSAVGRAFADARTLQADLRFSCAAPYADCLPPDGGGTTTRAWHLSASDNGSERLTALDGTDDHAYNAVTRVAREIDQRSAGVQPSEFTNLPAGPPDFTLRTALRREYGSLVRAFLASTDSPPVATVTDAGRQAWRLSIPVQPNKLAGPGNSGDHIDVVVDRQTGFPTHVIESLGTKVLFDTQLSNIRVNGALPADAFDLTFPSGVRVFHQDYGFHTVPLDGVQAATGYKPVLPASLPNGYRLAGVTVATQSQPTGAEGMNPPSRKVVSVAYRRGFDQIVVTNRQTGADRSAWEDPVATGEGFPDQREPVTLTAGAMAGAAPAEVVITPRGTPHAWAVNRSLVVTIAGDATGAELRAMLTSLS